jgi:hypothetical protein
MHGVGAAILNPRLQAAFLAVALALAQLLWANHEAKAAAHDPTKVCDLCLALANIGNALVDVAPPVQVPNVAVVSDRPTERSRLGVQARGWYARAPPRDPT